MCLGGGGGSYSAPAPAPTVPAVVAPISADTSAKASGEEEKRRRAAAYGRSDTILTSGLGDTSAVQTGEKKLLGQ
jgi:hypothetical protein